MEDNVADHLGPLIVQTWARFVPVTATDGNLDLYHALIQTYLLVDFQIALIQIVSVHQNEGWTKILKITFLSTSKDRRERTHWKWFVVP